METLYPTLKRPKRKLCFLPDKGSSEQWAGLRTLEDVDKMFDDLDTSSCGKDDLLQISENETNHSEAEASPVSQKGNATENLPVTCQKIPVIDMLQPATKACSPKKDMESPFNIHGPVKTSSPIEKNMAVEGSQEPDNENDQDVSPVLFACEADGKEEAKTESLHTQEADCMEHGTEEGELESPPSKIALSKPKALSPKNKSEGSGQENQKPQVTAETTVPDHTDPQQKPESIDRQPSLYMSTCEGKKMTAFRQRLRDDGQPKPACSRKSPSRVAAPTPPEPEDDFLILEDDTPVWISIPSKTVNSKKQKGNKTSSMEKESSIHMKTKDAPLEKEQKQQETELALTKTKRKKAMKRNTVNEEAESENGAKELCNPGALPDVDLADQVKTNKKKQQLKKETSEKSDGFERPEDGVSVEIGDENPTQKIVKKVQSPRMKKSKSSKHGNEKVKKNSAKSVKGGRKMTQESKTAKVTEQVEAVMEQSEEHQDAEDPGSLSDKEVMNSDTQAEKVFMEENNKQDKAQEESPSGENLTLNKRKRKQTGQWWLSASESKEEKVSTVNNQPEVKKAKQNKKEPVTTAPSPAKIKKDRDLKKGNQKQPVSSPSHKANNAKEKKTKQNKDRKKRQEMLGKRGFNGMDTEQIEEVEEQQQQEDQEGFQEEVQDQDDSSPLLLSHRELAHISGNQVFPKLYHNNSNEKMCVTSEIVTPKRPGEKSRAVDQEKRRRARKPPGDWWTVGEVESVTSQPQQQEPKPHKEKKKKYEKNKSSKLGTPKHADMAASLKAHGVTPTVKTMKRSLALFKNILTSGTETPTVDHSSGTARRKRSKVLQSLVEEVADPLSTKKTVQARTNMDGGQPTSPPFSSTPQDSRRDSGSMIKLLRSGPSSMIELEQYEGDDDAVLPSSRIQAALSVSDLCGPPLKPLILLPKDEANLTEWFKSLWSTSVNTGPEITPDQFDWYFHKGRAIGFQEDMNNGSICNGKILLGSHMKKPLWVDHSATTVFNVLTSSTKVAINSSESNFNPGQSFMVPCGSAYSIQNLNAQPAVLYFTRILAGGLD